MKAYTRPAHEASIDELNAAMDQLNADIYNGDRRAVDCCEEMNRLDRLILAAEEKRDRPHRMERALAKRSPETPFPEGI